MQIRLPLFQNRSVDAIRSPEYFAVLACYSDAQPEYRIRIPLRAVERSAETLVFLPSSEHHRVSTDEFEAARLTNCFILRTPPPLTPRLLSLDDLPESLILWKPKIIHLNTSTSTWDCLSEPKDPKIPPIRVPDQREKASYGVVLHPPSPYSDNTSSDSESTTCLKVLIRVDVGFNERYEVNVRIQLFHDTKNQISTDLENSPSLPSTEITSNSRSRIVAISTQLSETIHALASWKRASSQDSLSLKIDLTAVDRHRAHELGVLSMNAFESLLPQDPLVHGIYATILMLVLIMLGQPNTFPFEALGCGLSMISLYYKLLEERRVTAYARPEYRFLYWRIPFVPAMLLFSNNNFIEYDKVPSARYYLAVHWSVAISATVSVLSHFRERTGYKSTKEDTVLAEAFESTIGLESLLLSDKE